MKSFTAVPHGCFSPQQRDEKLSLLKEHCTQMVALQRKKVGDGYVCLTLSACLFAKLQFLKSDKLHLANHHPVQ